MSDRRRIVILGGGAGSLSAAYWLSQEGWESQFESITVYQRGWRLGGKGASGRGAHDRIEEHGLHVWFGFYDNAFRTLRGCYEELGRPESVPIRSIEDAFEPASTFVLTERLPRGWVPWSATFPTTDGIPGDLNEPARQPASMPDLLERSLELLAAQLRSVRTSRPETRPPRADVWLEPVVAAHPAVRLEPVSPAVAPASAPVSQGLRHLAGSLLQALRTVPLQLAEEAFAAALLIATSLHRDDIETPPNPVWEMARHVERAAGIVRRHVRPLLEGSDALRRQWYVVDLVLACVRGVLSDGLLTHGVDAVDDVEFVDWLVRHGAEEESARSALVTAVVYDLAFAYRHGDPADPACSSATALRGLARVFFGYKGAIAHKMRAGMGDIVFAPLYELLHRRGVRFEFFCDVTQLQLSDDKGSIGSITLSRQLHLRDRAREYQPLINVNGLPCWPARPLWDQLEPGSEQQEPDELEKMWSSQTAGTFTLQAGANFDVVVLGIGVGALGTICRPLVEHDPSWRAMVDGLGTVWTQALQLWLAKSPAELGNHLPGAIAGGFLEPFDTYADMPQLIERESWDGAVRGIAYFCNVLPTPRTDPGSTDATVAAQATEDVRRGALRFLQHGIADLLPGATRRYPADFRWELLVGDTASDTTGPARLRTQYWRANVDPSDRYVQSLPGTSRLRKPPGDSGFANLVLAGDWTDCGLNAGCVEAAATSGMLAAHSLWQRPALEEISGIDHLAAVGKLAVHTRSPQETAP
jgi:uncharacterized protein with NAD-binding domain and iron-sulfur cluster